MLKHVMLFAVGMLSLAPIFAEEDSAAQNNAAKGGNDLMCKATEGKFKNIPCVYLKTPGATVAVLPKMDGRIFSYVENRKGLDQFFNDPTDGFCMMFGGLMMRVLTGEAAANGDLTKSVREIYPQWHLVKCRTEESQDRCTLIMEPPCDLFNIRITVSLLRDGQLEVRTRVTLAAGENVPVMLCYRPMTCAGGKANRSTVITIPGRDGLRQYRYDPDIYLLETFPLGKDWIAAANADADETLIFKNALNMETAYFWSMSTSYYPELYSRGATLKAGESFEGGVDLRVIYAGAIDAIQGGLAAGCLPAAEVLLQPQPLKVLFSAASLDGSPAKGKVRLELRQAGEDKAIAAKEISYTVGGDAENVFEDSTSFETRDLADGDYNVVPVSEDQNAITLPTTRVSLVGSEAAQAQKKAQAILPRLHDRRKALAAGVKHGSVGAAVETMKLLGALVRCGTANEILLDYKDGRRNSRLGWGVAGRHAQEAAMRADALEGHTEGIAADYAILAATVSSGVPAMFESAYKGLNVTNTAQPFWNGIPVNPDSKLNEKIEKGIKIVAADIPPPLKPFEGLTITGLKELIEFNFESVRIVRGKNAEDALKGISAPADQTGAILFTGVFTPAELAAELEKAGIREKIEASAAGSLIDFHTLRAHKAGIICAGSPELFDRAWRLARATQRILARNRIWLGDMHTHTVESDGHCTPLRSVLAAQRAFMDFQAISDHGTVEGSRKGTEVLARLGFNFPLVWAQEGVSTTDKATHMLFYGYRKTLDINLDWAEQIKEAHAHGALAVLAHPTPSASAWQKTALADFRASGLDGVEFTLPIEELLKQGWPGPGKMPPILCNSDSHDDAFPGARRSVIFAPECTEKAILDALRDGRCIAYSGGKVFGNAELCDVFRAVCQEETYWKAEYERRVMASAKQILSLIERIGKDGM